MWNNSQRLDDSPDDSEENNKLFDIFAKLDISLSTTNSELKAARAYRNRYLERRPRSHSFPWIAQLDANGNGIADIGGPQPGREWIVRLLSATPAGYTATAETGSSASGAAGATTSTSIAGPGYVTGIAVSFGVATAAGTATITLSGVAGGPYTWLVEESTTTAVTFTESLSLAITSPNATLSVSAVTNGGTVNANLFATTGPSQATVSWFKGTNITRNINSQVPPPNLVIARMQGIPEEISYTSDVIRVIQNQEIYVSVQNGIANSSVLGVCYFLDLPAFGETR
jgi:hypothetical protein